MTVCCGDPNTDPFPMNWVGVEPIAVMANGRKWEEMGAFGVIDSHTSEGPETDVNISELTICVNLSLPIPTEAP